MPTIQREDFKDIGQLAAHCSLPKLAIAIQEAEDFDLSELFCPNWELLAGIIAEVKAYEVLPEWSLVPEPANYAKKLILVYGGTYEGPKERKIRNLGLIRTWVYYAYARYVILNGFNDTPTGVVSKNNEFSMPKSLRELQSFSDKYIAMGLESYKKSLEFLCYNTDIFTTFIPGDSCKAFECEDNSCHRSNTKVNGMTSRNIKKRI